MQDFKNKVAVITGGAGGVGRSLAFALGREGARVMIADVEPGALESTVATLRDAGIDARGQRCDVTKQEALDALADAAFAWHGHVDMVFANAGVGGGGSGEMWDFPLNDWAWCLNVNVWGVIHTLRAFVPRLIAQGTESHFSITGSGNGTAVMLPDVPIYTASKAAVQAIAETLYFRLQARNAPVRVHALFPGPHVVDTGIFDSERNRPKDLKNPEGMQGTGIRSVDDLRAMMKQMGVDMHVTHPDEVAATALQGLREDRFWILPLSEHTEAMARARFDGMMARENPKPTHVS